MIDFIFILSHSSRPPSFASWKCAKSWFTMICWRKWLVNRPTSSLLPMFPWSRCAFDTIFVKLDLTRLIHFFFSSTLAEVYRHFDRKGLLGARDCQRRHSRYKSFKDFLRLQSLSSYFVVGVRDQLLDADQLSAAYFKLIVSMFILAWGTSIWRLLCPLCFNIYSFNQQLPGFLIHLISK